MQACPRDKENLVVGQVHGFNVSHCKSCSGLWLPPGLVATAVGHLPKVAPAEAPTIGRRCLCPNDGGILRPIYHRGVEIDVCTECGGVWLDRGELEMILHGKRTDSRLRTSEKIEAVSRITIEGGGEVLSNLDLLSTVGEFAGDAVGTVLSFVAEALSGL